MNDCKIAKCLIESSTNISFVRHRVPIGLTLKPASRVIFAVGSIVTRSMFIDEILSILESLLHWPGAAANGHDIFLSFFDPDLEVRTKGFSIVSGVCEISGATLR